MKKAALTTAIFFTVFSPVFAAINFDSSAGGTTGSGTSLQYTITVSSTSTFLAVSVMSQANGNISAINANGIPLQHVGYKASGGTWGDDLWRLVSPPTGTVTVDVSSTVSTTIQSSASSYTGVDTTSPINATSSCSGTASPFSCGITTTVDNSWIVGGLGGDDGGIGAGSGTTARNIQGTQSGIFDGNQAYTPAGSNQLVITHGSSAEAMVLISLTPSSGSSSSTPSSTLSNATEQCVTNASGTQCYNAKDVYIMYILDLIVVLAGIISTLAFMALFAR